ncbi:MAG: hypothetical protein KatS3mg053_1080 [Candidatus Roseilinea sp.]|nr:MAG: hypothetical protein KatS3mg053_1080 [Candidatus Roseilinea sp.]
MYHETTRETLIRTYRIPEDYHAIDAAILLGEWNPALGLARWRERLSEIIFPFPFHNLIFGKRDRGRIAFGIAYGATFAADMARFCQLMGARRIIQIGYFGGLQPHMRRADLLVPTEAIRQDGASDAYLPAETRLLASQSLCARLSAVASTEGARVHQLPQLTIAGGILSETREQIAEWSARGYGGVDLETAATFAIAHRYGLEYAAILMCSDVVVESDTLFNPHTDDDARARYERCRKIMEETALAAACEASTEP